jgi:uncharacterized protein YjbI with pentapeptide repeats
MRKIKRFLEWVEQKPYLKAILILASIGALVGGPVIWLLSRGDEREEQIREAWNVINDSHGKDGDRGRRKALEALAGFGVSLAGVDIGGAIIGELNLKNANLFKTNLDGVVLDSANLSGTNLATASVVGAQFYNTDLRYARLDSTSFIGTTLYQVSLDSSSVRKAHWDSVTMNEYTTAHGVDMYRAVIRRAVLRGVHFNEASLLNTDFRGSDLSGADFSAAKLAGADLRGANLIGIKWRHIECIDGANVYAVREAPSGFLAWAVENGAVSEAADSTWNRMKEQLIREKSVKPIQEPDGGISFNYEEDQRVGTAWIPHQVNPGETGGFLWMSLEEGIGKRTTNDGEFVQAVVVVPPNLFWDCL